MLDQVEVIAALVDRGTEAVGPGDPARIAEQLALRVEVAGGEDPVDGVEARLQRPAATVALFADR